MRYRSLHLPIASILLLLLLSLRLLLLLLPFPPLSSAMYAREFPSERAYMYLGFCKSTFFLIRDLSFSHINYKVLD